MFSLSETLTETSNRQNVISVDKVKVRNSLEKSYPPYSNMTLLEGQVKWKVVFTSHMKWTRNRVNYVFVDGQYTPPLDI